MSWKCSVQHGYYNKLYCAHCLKAPHRVNLKCLYHKKKDITVWSWMLTRLIVVIMFQYIQMLNHCYIPKSNIMLYINYT